MLQNGKNRKTVSVHMHDTLKTNCEEKTQEKRTQKTVLTGIEPTSTKIDGFKFIYILKNERSTYCAIESLENYK